MPLAARPSNGADIVLRAFEAEGVTTCFGMPGGAILPIYDAIARGTSVRHVLVRHEQGAGHMAEAYARVSGSVGVVLATSGPGATNLVTPIANAQMDSTPLVCVTGQVRSSLIGTMAFQECDIVGVTKPLVKRSWQVRDVSELAGVLHDAFRIARSGRPGPVLVDVPRDVQEAWCEYVRPAGGVRLRDPEPAVDADAVAAVSRAVASARRPVLYVGGGVVNADAGDALRRLAERARIPVVTTLMAKGALPESHPLHLGCPGMHGQKYANWALNKADLVLAAGARFDDRVTGRLDAFAPDAVVAHFDVDPREISKLRHADIALVGSLGESLDAVAGALDGTPGTEAWLSQLSDWRAAFPLRYDTEAATLKPQRVLERLDAALRERDDVIWTTGVGQHQMWSMQYLGCERPRSFVTSGGHGTMGFGVPAAVGARAGRPGATVVCVDGDGSFQMTAQELATAVAARLPIVVVILNNSVLGMVDQWQNRFFEQRRSHTDLSQPTDCAAVARGFGAAAWTVRSEQEFEDALSEALACGRAAVLDVHVDRDEVVFPMIEPGAAAIDMVEYADAVAPPAPPLPEEAPVGR